MKNVGHIGDVYRYTFDNRISSNCIQLTTNVEQNFQNIKKTLQLALCIKLYNDFGCRGKFHYQTENNLGEEELKDVRSFEQCDEKAKNYENEEKFHFEKSKSLIRKRRKVQLGEIKNATTNISSYVQALLIKPEDEITEGLQKRQYNFFDTFFKYIVPDLEDAFDARMPHWKVNWKRIDWTFFSYMCHNYTNKELLGVHFLLGEMTIQFEKIRNKNETKSEILEKLPYFNEILTEISCYKIAHLFRELSFFEKAKNEPHMIEMHMWIKLRRTVIKVCKNFGIEVDDTKFDTIEKQLLNPEKNVEEIFGPNGPKWNSDVSV